MKSWLLHAAGSMVCLTLSVATVLAVDCSTTPQGTSYCWYEHSMPCYAQSCQPKGGTCYWGSAPIYRDELVVIVDGWRSCINAGTMGQSCYHTDWTCGFYNTYTEESCNVAALCESVVLDDCIASPADPEDECES